VVHGIREGNIVWSRPELVVMIALNREQNIYRAHYAMPPMRYNANNYVSKDRLKVSSLSDDGSRR